MSKKPKGAPVHVPLALQVVAASAKNDAPTSRPYHRDSLREDVAPFQVHLAMVAAASVIVVLALVKEQ
jgi:hypothetical protein